VTALGCEAKRKTIGGGESLSNLTRILDDRYAHILAREVDVSRHGLSVASIDKRRRWASAVRPDRDRRWAVLDRGPFGS
jgi:hypothetical protein